MKMDTKGLLYIVLMALVVSLTLNYITFLKVSQLLKLVGK